jgi:acyl-CoA hydrolase
MAGSAAARIAAHLRPGMRVALADGAAAPTRLLPALSEAAVHVGNISLVLGWCLDTPDDTDWSAFADVRTIMGGFGLREAVRQGQVKYVPERLTGLAALMAGTLRPDVLIVSLVRARDGWHWGTEVSWMPAVMESGATVLVVENRSLPRTAAIGPALALDAGVVITSSDLPPQPDATSSGVPDGVMASLGERAAAFIAPGSQLQFGPGALGNALCRALAVPVHVRTGVLTDAVFHLERKGLLLSVPSAAYVVGTSELYRWSDRQPITARLESTHHRTPGEQVPLVAVNTALEVDRYGQVNVQSIAGRHVSGLGGHPDFALEGHRSVGGLSVIALPSTRAGRSTLVPRLDGPASTPRCDVDVVVTERGSADLRGLDDDERADALERAWAPR